MSYVPISKLRLVDEQEVTEEITEVFDDMRRVFGVPQVGAAYKIMALSPPALTSYWAMYRSFLERATLPPPLLFMIHYAISSAKNCQYCSSNFEMACRSVGIDEEMLEALVSNLDAVNPQRVREIIKFAVKCALDAQGLTGADYDRVRDQGVSDEELTEVIGWAAIAILNDTASDAIKLANAMSQQFIED